MPGTAPADTAGCRSRPHQPVRLRQALPLPRHATTRHRPPPKPGTLQRYPQPPSADPDQGAAPGSNPHAAASPGRRGGARTARRQRRGAAGALPGKGVPRDTELCRHWPRPRPDGQSGPRCALWRERRSSVQRNEPEPHLPGAGRWDGWMSERVSVADGLSCIFPLLMVSNRPCVEKDYNAPSGPSVCLCVNGILLGTWKLETDETNEVLLLFFTPFLTCCQPFVLSLQSCQETLQTPTRRASLTGRMWRRNQRFQLPRLLRTRHPPCCMLGRARTTGVWDDQRSSRTSRHHLHLLCCQPQTAGEAQVSPNQVCLGFK